MKKTTKIHTYAALWLHHQKYSTEDIAKEIDLSSAQVSKILHKHQKEPDTTEESANSVVSTTKPNTKNLMITDSTAKKYKVAIMTKDASMANDELKKQTNTPSNTAPYIYRPNNG